MRVNGRNKLEKCWKTHRDSEQALKSWLAETEDAQWKTPGDVITRYGSARILFGNRIVFKIKGNNYRLVVQINYNIGIVYICFVGTHAEYDKVDAEKIG